MLEFCQEQPEKVLIHRAILLHKVMRRWWLGKIRQ